MEAPPLIEDYDDVDHFSEHDDDKWYLEDLEDEDDWEDDDYDLAEEKDLNS